MTDHIHDFDEIAARAAADIPLDDASCAVCADEYRLQREIRSLLLSSAHPEMSGPEIASLRSSVFSAMQSPKDRRLKRWVTVASVAAGLLVIVGIGPSLNRMESADETLAAPNAVTTAAAAPLQADATSTAPDQRYSSAVGAESAPSLPFSPISDGGAVTEAELIELEDQMLVSLSGSTMKLGRTDYANSERVAPPCLPEDPVFGSIEADLDGKPTVSYLIEDPAGERVIERFDATTCELLLSR